MKRRSRKTQDPSSSRSIGGVPVGYLELLRDYRSKLLNPPTSDVGNPFKRRRANVAENGTDSNEGGTEGSTEDGTEDGLGYPEDPSVSEGSDPEDSDLDPEKWEDVNIDQDLQDITIEFGKNVMNKRKRTVTRVTKEERARRILIHKMHLVCLIHHVSIRNKWCMDREISQVYRHLISKNTYKELYPPNHLSDTLKTRKFLDGLRHAMNGWCERFRIIDGGGIYCIPWNRITDETRTMDKRMNLEKFRRSLLRMKGSKDLAAQGFVALLRSVGIEARLVSSLQPLDFTSNTPSDKPVEDSDPPLKPSVYPVYWIEAWDRYGHNWVTVDPAMNRSVEIVRRKSKLEPPYSDQANNLRYVIAFNRLGYARDVTRRYSSHYNTKTAKKRITSVNGGQEWWDQVMNCYEKPKNKRTTYDLAELHELEQRELNEEMPNNLQDFRNHPTLVLEQNLRSDEVLIRKIPCGSLRLRNAKTSVPVYPRKDVAKVKSARNWYKAGRIVKTGQKPAKRTLKRSTRRRLSDGEGGDSGEDDFVPLYLEEQTEVYIPPPVKDGKVPKNVYNNIDIYTPSMVPEGAVHLPQEGTNIAARLIDVDYADAVVGFDFKHRQASARTKGIVVAEEFSEAVIAVYETLLQEQREEERQEAISRALQRWRRYAIHLQIKERLNRMHGEVPNEGDDPSSEVGSDLDDNAGAEADAEVSCPNVIEISDDSSGSEANYLDIYSVSSGSDEPEVISSGNAMPNPDPSIRDNSIKDTEDEGGFMADSMSESELYE